MKQLIERTLGNKFNLDEFLLFAKDLFKKDDISPKKIKIENRFSEFIKEFSFLGDYTDQENKNIEILAVELVGDTKVERARSFQRELIAKYLKDNLRDSAFVAFYSDNPDWRLSFVKMEYKLIDKGAKAEVSTPPKRYSFLVGETEPCYTARKQLLHILEDKDNPLISEIEDAFSVEKVTREFYQKYRVLFDNLSNSLKKNKSFQIIASKEKIDIDNFAKKLLGQIVFLYFLQKKGWLGVSENEKWGQGDKYFLRTLINNAIKEKKNFYNDCLEPLFYDTLNNPRGNTVDPSYSKYFKSRIPFLNGGLFEPSYDWKNTAIYLEDNIFDEILEVFDLYNFTVKEDEPLEKEVAVDPEMLGKVFENLLPENIRKGQGAYYTPREIVHYMCQESLINYLNTETKIDIEKIRKLIIFKNEKFTEEEKGLLDSALVTIKVCDPACGSGAFLVGMLNEIVGSRRIITNKKEYSLKKETIQNCIYGVDIDPGAVDISKLRLWLSLVVDHELDKIDPLPNLDYKIMCGNSLLEELIIGEESIKLFDERMIDSKNKKLFEGEYEGKIAKDEKLEYFKDQLNIKGKSLLEEKTKAKRDHVLIKKIEKDMTVLKKEIDKIEEERKPKVMQSFLIPQKAEKLFKDLQKYHLEYFTEYDPEKKKKLRVFIDDIEYDLIKNSIEEKIKGVDGIIKNLNPQKPEDRKKLPELQKKKMEYIDIPDKIRKDKVRPYFLWKLNFYEVFKEKGGFDIVIANPPYINVEKVDKNIKVNIGCFKTAYQKYDIYVLFYEKSITLLKTSGTLTFISSNKFLSQGYGLLLRKYFLQYRIDKIINFNYDIFDAATVRTCILQLTKIESFNNKIKIIDINSLIDIYKFNNEDYSQLNQEIFNETDENNFRINLTDNKIQLIKNIKCNCFKVDDICSVNYGLRPSSEKLDVGKDNFIKKTNQSGHYKKYFEGKNMGYWSIKDYKYLDYRPDVMYNSMFAELFENEKLVGLRTLSDITKLRFIYDEEEYYCNDSVVVLTLWYKFINVSYSTVRRNITKEKIEVSKNYSLKYLQGILNSNIIKFYVNELLYDGTHFYPNHMKQLPIKKCSKSKQKPLIEHVNKILAITKDEDYINNSNKQTKVKEYEHQINKIVYKLYGLTEDEIKIIENS
ncbi:MAG: TaqI-like C-terminal specificity domain-containing protein [Candidatus Firestonebacteria bacterium]